jgi:hypothetical protein
MNKSKVKVGDRLRCVEPVGRLIFGELYEVTGVGASTVDVVGPGLSETGGYFFSRFEPLTEPAAEAKRPEPKLRAIGNPPAPGGWFEQARREIDRSYQAVYSGHRVDTETSKAVPQPTAKVDPYWEERTGPYGGNDLGHEEHVAALTAALPANEAARKRNVAALAAEMRIPGADRKRALEKRFGPRPGIDDWSDE